MVCSICIQYLKSHSIKFLIHSNLNSFILCATCTQYVQHFHQFQHIYNHHQFINHTTISSIHLQVLTHTSIFHTTSKFSLILQSLTFSTHLQLLTHTLYHGIGSQVSPEFDHIFQRYF